jgi:hypothetical protein
MFEAMNQMGDTLPDTRVPPVPGLGYEHEQIDELPFAELAALEAVEGTTVTGSLLSVLMARPEPRSSPTDETAHEYLSGRRGGVRRGQPGEGSARRPTAVRRRPIIGSIFSQGADRPGEGLWGSCERNSQLVGESTIRREGRPGGQLHPPACGAAGERRGVDAVQPQP